MMFSGVIAISVSQVAGDLTCLIFSLLFAFRKNSQYKIFFMFNSIAFLSATFCDSYYDYYFRITRIDIEHSVGLAITLPVFIFQMCQAYNWYSLIKKKTVLFSSYNLPYFIFAAIVSAVLIYYFVTEDSLSISTVWYQSISVSFDMLIWIFSIICLARATSYPIIFLALGCLMIISADLTTRCLFMFEMHKLASAGWIHSVWTMGVLVMAVGFFFSFKNKVFEFCHPDSLQVVFSAWISFASLIVFMIGFFSLSFLRLSSTPADMHSTLWTFPVALMFIMIFSVLSGNRFSHFILLPLNNFIKRINYFNSGVKLDDNKKTAEKVYEFQVVGNFISSSFHKLSNQLECEINLAKQVSHDIRSPLSSLDILIKRISGIAESKYILLRDVVGHMRDIISNLEKNTLPEKNLEKKSMIQISVIIDSIISERQIAFSEKSVDILCDLTAEYYGYFVNVVPTEMKRILTNIINNACEALSGDKKEITITLESKSNQVIIVVSDNGVGISEEAIASLFKRGFTTKKTGSGLGLSHAKENIEAWGGTINLSHNTICGTSVFIALPLELPPSWFVNTLEFKNNTSVVCVDDSISIFYAWRERFDALNVKVELIYCKSKEEFLLELNNKQKLFLIDYEFSGKNYNGRDLIEILLKEKYDQSFIFLVTSLSGDVEVQKFCVNNNIKIIPKCFAFKIPLKVM